MFKDVLLKNSMWYVYNRDYVVWLPVVSSSHIVTPYVHVLRDYSRSSILPEVSFDFCLHLTNEFQKQFSEEITYLRNFATSIILRHKTQNGCTFSSLM